MLHFIVIGDWGRANHPGQRRLADRMGQVAKAEPIDFIISTGDNFYDTGVVGVDDPHWASTFEDVYQADSLRVPWHVVLGNHDYDGNVQAQIDYTRCSSRWHLPDRYHHFQQPVEDEEVLFVFLDTSPFINSYYLTEPKPAVMAQDPVRQLRWLEEVLATSRARWKIVVGHHPVYSSSPFHGNAPELIKHFVPLFEAYGVDLYLAGHEHDLQWHHPKGNTHYLVSGAGSEVRETGHQPFTRFSASALGFARVAVSKNQLEVAFIDDRGRTLYREWLTHRILSSVATS